MQIVFVLYTQVFEISAIEMEMNKNELAVLTLVNNLSHSLQARQRLCEAVL